MAGTDPLESRERRCPRSRQRRLPAGAPVGQRIASGCPGPATMVTMGRTVVVLSGSALSACMEIAARICTRHGTAVPGPSAICMRATSRSCSARTCDRPVDAVTVCWTPGGVLQPAAPGMAIRIAETHGIPVLNLGSMSPRSVPASDWSRSAGLPPCRRGREQRMPGECPAGVEEESPAPMPGRAIGKGGHPCSCPHSIPVTTSSPRPAARCSRRLGVDRHTVREVGEDDRAIRCPDRDSVLPDRSRRGPRRPHALRGGTARGGAPEPPSAKFPALPARFERS